VGADWTRRSGSWEIVDHPLDAVSHHAIAEVQNEAELQIDEPQVAQDLLHVHRSEAFHRLDLDDDASFDEKIDPKALLELDASICESDRSLALDVQPLAFEGGGERHLVDGLEQSRPRSRWIAIDSFTIAPLIWLSAVIAIPGQFSVHAVSLGVLCANPRANCRYSVGPVVWAIAVLPA
jgi:hypothetical protein